jgi:hypothetical protein
MAGPRHTRGTQQRRRATTRISRPGTYEPPARITSATPAVVATPPPVEPRPATEAGERSTGRITITRAAVVDGALAEQMWEFYRGNFEPLTTRAILQHLFTHDEILAELANPQITKIIAWSGGEPVGLGLVTTDLESVPQVSPDFLRVRYPDHAARDAIHYGIMVVVAPSYRGRTLSARLSLELWRLAAEDRGVLVFDVCNFNRTELAGDALAEFLAAQFPGSSVGVVDQQSWFVAELPNPLPEPLTR